MNIAPVIKKTDLDVSSEGKRLTLREGYSTLVSLGWPTQIIPFKMCDQAEADVMRRYMRVQSWIAYKEEWEWAESTAVGSGQTLYRSSID